MDIDKCTISKLVTADEMLQALDEGLAPELFEGEGVGVWEWCQKHFRDHGVGPGRQALEQQYPHFLVDTTETLSFYTSQLRRRFAYNNVMDGMRDATKLLNAGEEPLDAAAKLREALALIDDFGVSSEDVDWTKSIDARMSAYDKLKELGGIDGIRMGWESLDLCTQGMHAEELIYIVARQAVGKSWCIVIMAHHNWVNGERPILFTKEMAVHQISRRLDAKHSRLGYKRFRAGLLDTAEEMRWRNDLEKLKERQPLVVVGEGGGGVSRIVAKIKRYKATIAYIDGGYLIEDERGAKSQWERVMHVARDLKLAAKHLKIPIVVSFQFSKDASRTHGGPENIAYSDISKEADVIIGMFQTEDQRLAQRMTIRILKQREGEQIEVELTWDLERMEFAEVGEETTTLQEMQDSPMGF